MAAYEKLREWLDSGVKLYTPYLTKEDVEECVEALEKQIPMKVASDIDRSWGKDKYRWHDLRKNPEDLPREGVRVLLCCTYDGYKKRRRELPMYPYYVIGENVCGTMTRDDSDYLINREQHHIIAWREIEPFEE